MLLQALALTVGIEIGELKRVKRADDALSCALAQDDRLRQQLCCRRLPSPRRE
jgi:hypothetical protein